ncbi:MAG: hypothetical protein A3D75_00200 [Candidatus Levybacteria bacterium RIFCSPHIGHO2_02_FULL_37_18]|nr:MAG: hypothetical protein A3D75_00200 [Candidatus Levybacteria bacterium RIFCSPHIGHO2_02_FULL_37_18]OGH43665.1 MAG: hypothetical protein A3J14_02970 [Candidatus Levybacteria bacterium RIFCSPLOWO2_02_FULL_37_18]
MTKAHKIYTTMDIKLLEKTDELHLRMSEKATLEILRRENEIFGHREYQTISGVSPFPFNKPSTFSDLQKWLDKSYKGSTNSNRNYSKTRKLWPSRLN